MRLRNDNRRFWDRFMHWSYARAERNMLRGDMGGRDFDRFCRLWNWGAARFSGEAGALQDQYFNDYGPEALDRRRDRVARLFMIL
jgi:hypothetical protein